MALMLVSLITMVLSCLSRIIFRSREYSTVFIFVGSYLLLLLAVVLIFAEGQTSLTPIFISDIIKVRLYDKIFVHEFLITNPNNIIQLYTNFLYDYRTDLFRHGAYEDIFGWTVSEQSRLCNYDITFLAKNRFLVKRLVVTALEFLNPEPDGYYYRTFFIVGFEFLTGIPFKLGVHDGEVWGIFLSDEVGRWNIYTGRNPFIDNLSFRRVSIAGDYRLLDLLYYVPSIEDYYGPMALDERIRVFSLHCDKLELTPQNPVVIYPLQQPTLIK